jgi:hypothetical protein
MFPIKLILSVAFLQFGQAVDLSCLLNSTCTPKRTENASGNFIEDSLTPHTCKPVTNSDTNLLLNKILRCIGAIAGIMLVIFFIILRRSKSPIISLKPPTKRNKVYSEIEMKSFDVDVTKQKHCDNSNSLNCNFNYVSILIDRYGINFTGNINLILFLYSKNFLLDNRAVVLDRNNLLFNRDIFSVASQTYCPSF